MVDVNGTRHYLIFGAEDWEQYQPKQDVDWLYDPDHKAATLRPQPFVFPHHASDPILTVDNRRGASRDSYGHWYWISDDSLSICVRWVGAKAGDHYWAATDIVDCPPDDGLFHEKEAKPALLPEPLAGLAVTTGHYLVVGSRDTGSLLVFDLHTGGAPPIRVALPLANDEGALTIPFDLAPLANGGVVVLDRVHRIAWVLDETFRPTPLPPSATPESPLFQPKDEPPYTLPGTPVYEPLALADCVDPISIEPMPDGSFLVLDLTSDASTVRRCVQGTAGAVGSVQLIEAKLRDPASQPIDLAPIIGHDIALVGGNVLFVVNTAGNQAFALTVSLDDGLRLRVQSKFFPLRNFSGKALVAPFDDSYAYYDQGERWLPIVKLPRQRYDTKAEIVVGALDGHDPHCIWHRLCIDACIPSETSISVSTRAADTEDALDWQPWQPEPTLYLRGAVAEIPYYTLWSADELRQPDTGTWELLFQNARGRFLQIRLELTGNGRATPVMRALRAHYPRFSYLTHYLPALYQNDPVSASFLERFLANPEGILTTLEGMIGGVQAYFDVRTTDAVDWLAAWLGLAFDATWSDYQRRLMIAHAPYFFLRRGTLVGVMQAIRLALDPSPAIFQDNQDDTCSRVRIVERFRTRYSTNAALGDPTSPDTPLTGDLLEDARVRAHRFVVLLPATVNASQVALVEQIVNVEKPAHTDFSIRQFWALFRVGEVRLGIDTTLGEGGRFELIRLGETALAEGYLGEDYPYNLTDRTVLAQ